jgi:Predicted aminoglycoside phosphotransferase
MINVDIDSINKRITDRSNAWYWQTGRDISLEEAMGIWTDKHSGINTRELLNLVNQKFGTKVVSIFNVEEDSQENLGFVNSVRKGKLADGTEIIIRCHPKGVKNGYFYVESLASNLACNHGLPSYKTYHIHELENRDDISFQIIEKCKGIAVQKWFDSNPQDVDKIMIEAGKTLAKIHEINVPGFGPFDNEQAKKGNLVGIHDSFAKSVRAGLQNSLNVLIDFNVITQEQSEELNKLYSEDSPLLKCDQGVLIHKDFVDWNMLTDGNEITGIVDWDECASGDPVADIASWSSMNPLSRMDKFLQGYFESKLKPELFDEKLQLLSLRCTIDNMALRSQRSQYIESDHLNELIALGKEQMAESFKYFQIGIENQDIKEFR